MTSVSPASRSAMMYFARRHSLSTRRPVRRFSNSSGDGFVVSRSPSVGSEGLDLGILGAVRQRQAREVLSPHRARAQTPRCRAIQMGGVLPCDGTDFESAGSGGLMIAFFRKLGWLLR